jgi:chaperonin GroES
MAVAIKPLEDRIVVKASEAETTTASGLVIPDTAKEKPMQGKVIAVGKGAKDKDGKLIPLDVKVGDKVYFGTLAKDYKNEYLKYTNFKNNDENLIVMSWQDVCFVEEIE